MFQTYLFVMLAGALGTGARMGLSNFFAVKYPVFPLGTMIVNITGCLVNMIELARRFDVQIKALHTAEEDGQASAKLLQSS